ncbi:MAG TPA: glycine cleavage T C-terminal barrel domain-containing protein [Candidatus Binatia bacterium]|nr:glycine cleavage T C-terminal barrel domain-containing protein [Candidatus Binatia bacterium]
MALTPLQQRISTPRQAEYRGSTVAAAFSSPEAEYAAFSHGCAIYDLGFRAQLHVRGADRVRWMNGMVTNNVRDLAAGHGVYAFLLNPQGHILGDMFVFNVGDSLMVETDRSQVEKIMAAFDHYIIMDDVEVTDESEQWTALGISGPQSVELLQRVGINFPGLNFLQMASATCDCDCGCVQCTVIRVEGQNSYQIILPPKDVETTWRTLIAAGATPVGSEVLDVNRIAGGVPLYGVDIRERDLPQETEQAQALNFNKGCYIGQEIVERIRSRGSVHRKFTGFLLESLVSPGARIFAGEKEVGEITSVAAIPTAEKQVLALGYIRREAGMPGREVQVAGVPAKVAQFPITGTSQESIPETVLHN